MKVTNVLAGAIGAVILACACPTFVDAAPRAACSVLALSEVRAIAGAAVAVYDPGSSAPTQQGRMTFSSCTYTLPGLNGPGARLMLMWGSSADLAATNAFYVKRHKETGRIKGDAFILASVTNTKNGGISFDRPASSKLLEAAVPKL
jgi:hypothetical protein